MLHVSLGLSRGHGVSGREAASIEIISPKPYAYLESTNDASHAAYNPNHPVLDLVVVFKARAWDSPLEARAIAVTVDGQTEPWAAVIQGSHSPHFARVALPKGSHSVTACVVRAARSQAWVADLNPEQAGEQRVCHTITVRNSNLPCHPHVLVDGQLVCDINKPLESCCFDDNPCSADKCLSTPRWDGNGYESKCLYGLIPTSHGFCCISDFDCLLGERCLLVDAPGTTLDDERLHRCYECNPLSRDADASCDDGDDLTEDLCNESWDCEHTRKLSPDGSPLCVSAADCDDDDPCTIDECLPSPAFPRTTTCQVTSYQELSHEQLLEMGLDPGDFHGCCVPGKESEYCTEHRVLVEGQVVNDACWSRACLNKQCHYEEITDPMCCNSGSDCEDCAVYGEGEGCAVANLCTNDACVDQRCEFSWNPLSPADEPCCQTDIDCEDGLAYTIDRCATHRCQQKLHPLYCDPYAIPPVPCPTIVSTCRSIACNVETKICETGPTCETLPEGCDAGLPGSCCASDDDCWDGDPCTEDQCDPSSFACVFPERAPDAGASSCALDGDCFDGLVCTADACNGKRCCHEPVHVSSATCPSGRCCESDADANADGRADDCEDLDPCTTWACVAHCCVPSLGSGDDGCASDLDCEDGDPSTSNACVDCSCVETAGMPCEDSTPCVDDNPCTIDSCDPQSGLCEHAPLADCCLRASDCLMPQAEACTIYDCDPTTRSCHTTLIPDCCVTDDDPSCDDQDPCTVDTCLSGACHHEAPTHWCCETDLDCDDRSHCTDDACVAGFCEHLLRDTMPDCTPCCSTDEDCVDPAECTLDLCQDNHCVNIPIYGCCTHETVDPRCDDGNPCTADWCLYGWCRHLAPDYAPLTSIPPNCCISSYDCPNDGNPNTNDICKDGLCMSCQQ